LTLAVLSNLAAGVAPSAVLYLCMTVGISLLMVSTIAFPPLAGLLAGWRTTALVLGLIGATLMTLPFFTTWLVWTSLYVGVAVGRWVWRHVR
jgi:phosphatidylserine synthase